MQPCRMQPCSSRRTCCTWTGGTAQLCKNSREGEEESELCKNRGYLPRLKILYTLLALTHAHPCLYQATQHLSPGTEGLSVHNTSKWLPRESQMEVTFKRTPSCSTLSTLCPWVGAAEFPQERWDFRRFLRPALAPRWAPFISPLNWPCIFARFLLLSLALFRGM